MEDLKGRNLFVPAPPGQMRMTGQQRGRPLRLRSSLKECGALDFCEQRRRPSTNSTHSFVHLLHAVTCKQLERRAAEAAPNPRAALEADQASCHACLATPQLSYKLNGPSLVIPVRGL
jgi:hypothetical protein